MQVNWNQGAQIKLTKTEQGQLQKTAQLLEGLAKFDQESAAPALQRLQQVRDRVSDDGSYAIETEDDSPTEPQGVAEST